MRARRGLRPDELVRQVKLPPHLADSPHLQEYYGTVESSVRAIDGDRLGWFVGSPTHLFRLPEEDGAQRLVALASGACTWAAERQPSSERRTPRTSMPGVSRIAELTP